MKSPWLVSDLVFPQDKERLVDRLTDRFTMLSATAQKYRLEAKYLLAGEGPPYSSIVLFNPAWSEEESLAQVVHKLEQEYGCPVILIGEEGKGFVKPDRSFLLEQASFLLKEWDQSGRFVTELPKIEQVIDRWRKLCRPYRSGYSGFELKTEATIPYDRLTVRDWLTFYQIVFPFVTERPLFHLSSVPVSRENISSGKDFQLNVKGVRFIWQDQREQEQQLKQWQKINLVFYMEVTGKLKWQGTIVAVEPARDGKIPL